MARVALVAAPLLLGGAVFAATWSSYAGVVAASSLLVRGQAETLHDAVRGQLAAHRGAVESAGLEELVDELTDEGLTWVAVVNVRGEILAQGGAPVDPDLALSQAPNGEPMTVGDRVRVVFRGPSRRRPTRDGAPRLVAIELVPRTAIELRATARQTLVVGSIASLAFVAVAGGLVAWVLRQHRREEERRLAALGRMSAVLAHEIRNPLASLKGNAQLLARGLPEGEKPRAKADRVVGEALRLETLVNALLDFAREGELRLGEIDPVALVTEVTQGRERIDLATAGAPARWRLDPERMKQVLNNLVDNALQAGEGRVTVGVARRGGSLAITVRDHGGGIAAEDLPQIFEPFFTRRHQGTGLGLAVARRIVDLHGGSIAAENGEGGGALFTVLLPA